MNIVRKIGLAAVTAVFFGMGSSAWAERIPGTNLDVFGESANLGASGREITLRRLPVRNALTGELNYYDVTFGFTINGDQFVAEAIRQIDVTPALISSVALRSGSYRDTQGNEYRLEGPSVSQSGYQSYSLVQTLEDGTDGLRGFNMTVTTRPIAERLENSNITSVTYQPEEIESYRLSEQNGNVFGLARVERDGDVNWDLNSFKDIHSLRAISENTMHGTAWLNGEAFSHIVLTRIGD